MGIVVVGVKILNPSCLSNQARSDEVVWVTMFVPSLSPPTKNSPNSTLMDLPVSSTNNELSNKTNTDVRKSIF